MNSDDVRAVNWLDIIEALELKPDRDKLPALLNCPLCQRGILHVYHDPSCGSWAYCGKCTFTGDPISLACKVWKMTPADTIKRLIAMRRLETTEAFIKTYEDTKAAKLPFERLWESAEVDYLQASRHLPGAPPNNPSPAWKSITRAGRRATAVKAYYGARNHVDILPKDWKEFAIMPLDTVPGRPGGALVMHDGKFRILAEPAGRYTLTFGLGITRDIGGFVIISDDIQRVVRMQLESMRANHGLAPVCGMYNRGSHASVWNQIRQKKVFWSTTHTLEVFREAASCDGYVVIRNRLPPGDSINVQLKHLNRASAPWYDVLNHYLAKLYERDRKPFVMGIGLSNEELQQLIETASHDVQVALSPLLARDGDTVRYGRYEVTRKNTELYVYRIGNTGHRPESEKHIKISDAIMNIERVVINDGFFYSGEVKYRHKSFRFTNVPVKEIEDDPEFWIRTQFWQRGVQAPYIHSDWQSRFIPISLQFGKQEYINEAAEPGWLFERDGLSTARWFMGRKGEITEWAKPAGYPPGKLTIPIPMSTAAIGAISSASGASAFWSVMAYVAASVLAPITGRTPKNLLLMGSAARYIGSVAAKCAGCSIVSTSTLPESARLLAQLQLSAKAKWPALLLTDSNYSRLPDLMMEDNPLPSIYRPANDYRGMELLISRDCDLIDINESVSGLQAYERFGSDVLPAYLLHLAHREFKILLQDDVTSSMLSDMNRWWAEIGGHAKMHRRFFHEQSKTRQCLHRLLMMCRSRLGSLPLGFGRFIDPTKIPIETDNQFMYFEPERMQRIMAHRIQLDMLKLGTDLKAANLLLGEPEDKIWTLPIAVWDRVITAATRTARIGPEPSADPGAFDAEESTA